MTCPRRPRKRFIAASCDRKKMQKAWEFARGDAAFEDKVVID
jgi:hypothetical protein